MKTIKSKGLGGMLGCLVALGLILSLAAPALATEPPPHAPHRFWGNVTAGGNPAPEGTEVSAKVDGVERASTTVDAEGRYGWYPVFQVPGHPGEEITFYGAGVSTNITHPFEPGGFTERPLVIGDVIAPKAPDLGT